jgi:hypothetical protein
VWSGDRKVDPSTGSVPPIRSTVDIVKAMYSNTVGSTELKTVWTDPQFDPGVHAFYYARVLEIPTPRWSTIQARQVGIAPPDVVPTSVQERAWSSPIWYTPSAGARKSATPGTTVADLSAKGATALTDDDLKALIVGKSYWLRNTVTGEVLKARYDDGGSVLMLHVGKRATLPSTVGNVPRNVYLNVAWPYSIRDGKIVTMLSGTPIEMAVYKLGNQYFGARSNEFGYANYEILAKGPNNLIKLKKGEYDKEDQTEYLHTNIQE